MYQDKEKQKTVLRERKRRYRQKHRTVGLSYSFDKLQLIKKEAKALGMKVPAYMKVTIENSLQHCGYILPSQSNLQELILDIRKVSNNINQLVRYCHTHREVKEVDIVYLQQEIGKLENLIIQALKFPPEISLILQEYLSQNPHKISTLILWLNKYSDDNKNTVD